MLAIKSRQQFSIILIMYHLFWGILIGFSFSHIKTSFTRYILLYLSFLVFIIIIKHFQLKIAKQKIVTLTKKHFDNHLFIEETEIIDYVEKAFKKEVEQRNHLLKEFKDYQKQTDFILESINRGVVIINQNHIIFYNTTFMSHLNLEENILYEPYHKVLRSYDLKELIKESKQSKAPIIRTIEINQKPLQVRAITFDSVKTLLIIRDLNEYRLMESVKRDFFSYASHELKTPITAIKGYAELIFHNMVDEKETKELADRINESASFMSYLVDDMLMLSKLEYLKDSKKTAVNLNRVLDEVLKQLESSKDNKKIELILDTDPEIIYESDELDMLKLFKNLIENGIRYNKTSGKLYVTLKKEAEHLVFKVKDEGLGISEEHKRRIFERFYRINQGREQNGTGLGLAIVKHIVINYKGTIELKTQLSQYSEFIVKLPL